MFQSVPVPPLHVVISRCEPHVGSIFLIMSEHSFAKSVGNMLSFCNPQSISEGEFLRSFTHCIRCLLKLSLNCGESNQMCAENCGHHNMPSASSSVL